MTLVISQVHAEYSYIKKRVHDSYLQTGYFLNFLKFGKRPLHQVAQTLLPTMSMNSSFNG